MKDKRKNLKKAAVIFACFVAVVFSSCKKDCKVDEVLIDNKCIDIRNTITLTANSDVYILMAGIGTVTVNWGDGTLETYTLSTTFSSYWHNYDSNNLYNIIIIGNVTEFCCYNVQHLDISKNTALKRLSCSCDSINLDLSKNTALIYLDIRGDLANLDISKNTALMFLCVYANLTNLDVSNNTALQFLDCSNNSLTSLDLSKNTTLTYLRCVDNDLTSLDISKNTALTSLDCHDNNLNNLDVSNNTMLNYMDCDNNGLINLYVSKNTKLTSLFCSENQLEDTALNNLFGTLHSNIISEVKIIYIYGNPGSYSCDRSIAESKGWTVY